MRHDMPDISSAIFFNNKELIEAIYYRYEYHNIRRAKLFQNTRSTEEQELIQNIQGRGSMFSKVPTTDLLKQSVFIGKSFTMTKEEVTT